MKEGGTGCTLEGNWKGIPLQWTLPFSDRASVGNALTAALLLLELGWAPNALDARLSALRPLGMRLEHSKAEAEASSSTTPGTTT